MHKSPATRVGLLALASSLFLIGFASNSTAADYFAVADVPCEMPPPVHCPDANCPGEITSNLGNAIISRLWI